MKTHIFLRQSFICLIFVLYCFKLSAQTNWDTLPWKQYADWKLQNLNKSFISTNILYDRSFPIANVNEYKGTPANNTDTTTGNHWIQA